MRSPGACVGPSSALYSARILSGVVFLALSLLPLAAQVPQEAGAPPGDVSNIPKPVISTVDSITVRNGPNDALTNKKIVKKEEAVCLLPPLTLMAAPIVAAGQLQIPAKAKKQYQQACSDLRSQKTADGEKHLRAAVHEYAKYSAAWVTLGQVLAAQKRTDEAHQACSQAAIVEPSYVPAHLCLADIAARTHDWVEVLKLSEQALVLGSTQAAVVAYEYHAAANLNLHRLPEAEKSALRAVEMDRDHHEPRVHFVLAQIYEARGDKQNETRQLREYLKYAENSEDVATVKNILLELENHEGTNKAAVPPHEANSRGTVEASVQSWAPADIDELIPPVQADASCPLPQVLKETSKRTEDLIQSLQRFSADERIEQLDLDKQGKRRDASVHVVNYVAQIDDKASGYPKIKEYRSGIAGIDKASLVDGGMAVFALMFHPTHIASFDFRCEGSTSLRGTTAWQLHFEEGSDPNQSFQAIRVGGSLYLPRLKGRAWIATDSYEVLRIETDLASPIPQLGLEREHLVISYASVDFKSPAVRLWVPETTSLYMAYRGHRYVRAHAFSHFHLFSVDSDQAIKEPPAPPKQVPPQFLPNQSNLLASSK